MKSSITITGFKYIKFIGLLVSLAALGFAFEKAVEHQIWTLPAESSRFFMPIIIAGGGIGALNNMFLAFAWHSFLAPTNNGAVKFSDSFRLYARTWLGKYLPGNIFHFAARHVGYARIGIGHLASTAAIVFEILGQITISALMGIWGVYYNTNFRKSYYLHAIVIIGALAVVGVIVGVYLFSYLSAKREDNDRKKALFKYCKAICRSYGYYLCYFLVYGILGWVTSGIVASNFSLIGIKNAIFIFSFAWVAGFVIPGAPAGLGIRETMLILGLHPFVGESGSTLIAFIMRLMVFCGDLLFFGMSYINLGTLSGRLNKK